LIHDANLSQLSGVFRREAFALLDAEKHFWMRGATQYRIVLIHDVIVNSSHWWLVHRAKTNIVK